MTTTATIIHHNGSGEVQDFERIEELDDQQTLRVYYEKTLSRMPNSNLQGPTEDGLYYEAYHCARIVEVDAESDDGDEGGGFIQVDT